MSERIPWTDPGGTPCCCTVCQTTADIPNFFFTDPIDGDGQGKLHRQISSSELLLLEAGGTYEVEVSGGISWGYNDGTNTGGGSLTINTTIVSANLPPPRTEPSPVFLQNCGIGSGTLYNDLSPDPFRFGESSANASASLSLPDPATDSTIASNNLEIGYRWLFYSTGLRQNGVFVGPQAWRRYLAGFEIKVGSSASPLASITYGGSLSLQSQANGFFSFSNVFINTSEVINGEQIASLPIAIVQCVNGEIWADKVRNYGSASGGFDFDLTFTSNAP